MQYSLTGRLWKSKGYPERTDAVNHEKKPIRTEHTDLTGREYATERKQRYRKKKQEQRRMRYRFAPVLSGMIRITVSNAPSDYHLHNQKHSDRKH